MLWKIAQWWRQNDGQWKPKHLTIKLTWWCRFRGYSQWETWELPPNGRSFNLTVALRPKHHSIFNWMWSLQWEDPNGV